jgi:predicted AlkP superfamily pyrophosphatase or phosphodiesterase
MPHHFRRLLVVIALLSVPASLRPAAQSGQDRSAHVVLISLDGFTARALADPALPLPTLRRLAKDGATARVMTPANPTVTWANHTSIISGVTPAKHGVIFNGLLVHEPGMPPKVEPWRDKSEMVHAPTLYDIAHGKGLTTAQVDWVAIWNAPTVTWEFRERPDPANPISREMVAAGLVSQEDVDGFSTRNIVFRDRVWTDAAAHIIRTHKPNLMMFHLLTLDSVQHRYGPDTLAAQSTMAHLDGQVAEIVKAVEQAGILDRTTFVIVSDHGFKRVKRQINPNVALAKAGLVQVMDGKATKAEAWIVPEGGTALAYVTVPDADGSRLARVKQALAGIEGIDRVIDPSGYAALGLPLPSASDQMGPLFLTAKDGYAFTAGLGEQVVGDASEGSFGAHGYVNTDPELGAIFIASGRGIRAGVALDAIRNVDVAPTIARLLGLDLPNADGTVLAAILAGR